MNCSTLIGIPAYGGAYAGRLLHDGGDPEQMLPLLRGIWQHTANRDTLTLATSLLGHDWVRLDHRAPRPGWADRHRPVPGIGYTTDLQDGPRRGQIHDRIEGYLEWMYLIDIATDSVQVYEATRHTRWLPHSRHLLDPNSFGLVLGCGGYTADGHRWNGVSLRPAGIRGSVSAEICTAPHPNAAKVLRFTDFTAEGISLATAFKAAEAQRREPWLRPVGGEFDLVWPSRRAPHRLSRDADGLLLLDVEVPGWLWWLQDASGEGVNQ